MSANFKSVIYITVLFLIALQTSFAEIRFDEITEHAGLAYHGRTYGASWGDFNGDGWPDLWVGHHGNTPSLYLNNTDGTFTDISRRVMPKNALADGHDGHGAAWGDFDNDGDQDLIELVGAERGKGAGANHLFVNEDGKLVNKAFELNVDYPLGRGRTPLWLDADRDGWLDLIVVNHHRPDRKAPSVIFRQIRKKFQEANHLFGFRVEKPSRFDKIFDLVANLKRLRFRKPRYLWRPVDFAQLADISGDRILDLVVYSRPMRIYSLATLPFKDITVDSGLPSVPQAKDAAIEDFNGDGRLDFFFTRAPYNRVAAEQVRPSEVRGHFLGSKEGSRPTIQFTTGGEVSFEVFPPWVVSEITDGSTTWKTDDTSFSLSLNTKSREIMTSKSLEGVLSIQLSSDGLVSVTNKSSSEACFIATSTTLINHLLIVNSKPAKLENSQMLVLQQSDGGFIAKSLPLRFEIHPGCHSVVAGDFDNDMDVDVYLVSKGLVINAPNILLENDGNGNFVEVNNAGGAAGSQIGLGDVVVTSDYDRDGFLDLFVTNGAWPNLLGKSGPHQLFHNEGNANHWLEIDLSGMESNREGTGAFLELEVGGRTLIRQQTGGMHYRAQNHQRIHFGLGSFSIVDHLTIYWPSGIIQNIDNIEVDQVIHVVEPITSSAATNKE